jgi:hypothetical protein
MPKDATESGKVSLREGMPNGDVRALEATLKTAEDLVRSLPDAPEVTELIGLITRALSLAGTLADGCWTEPD